ncbi:MAG: hypothetical protein U0M42_06515 [Acutalibacteraceae bacterium]|nr:hypothetical protein [Acutalibacteraceae bacterium]
MSKFDNAATKIGEALGVFASATEKVVEKGKSKYNIAVINNKLEKAYTNLGKTFFENNSKNESIDGQYISIFNDIKKLITELNTAKEDAEKI